jgi:hypothetical protein
VIGCTNGPKVVSIDSTSLIFILQFEQYHCIWLLIGL